MHACMKIKNQYSNKPIITFLRRQLKSNRPDQQSADNMLDPLARGLHADVSLFCFFCFYTKRKVFESLNVINEMVSVQRATIKFWIHLRGLLSTKETRVTPGYRLVRLLCFFRA